MPRPALCVRLLVNLFIVVALVWVAWSAVPFNVRAVVDEPHDPALPPANLAITASVPLDGFVDVRADVDDAGLSLGITSVLLRFNQPIQLDVSHVAVISTVAPAPVVTALQGADTDWTLVFDRPPAGGASTAIVLFGGVIHLLFHAHPGDVNLDGVTDGRDLDQLTAALAAGSATVESHDVDRSGAVDDLDRQRLESMLDAGYAGRVWTSSSTPPRVVCCCAAGYCNVHVGNGCQDGDTEAACPCVPNPCPPNGASGGPG